MLLIEAGATLNLTRNGVTALDIADEQGLESVAAAMRARGGLAGAELAARA
jgi:ankyrin repeat protein